MLKNLGLKMATELCANDMYDIIKRDIAGQYYLDNYPNEGQRFVAWYLRNIHNLESLETPECVTDGANDKQVDAIVFDHDIQTVYIIQCKFKNGVIDAKPLGEILTSLIYINNLNKFYDYANTKLKNWIKELGDAVEANYDFVFQFVTTAALTESAKHAAQLYQERFREEDTINASLEVIDRNMLQSKYDESIDKPKPYINYEFELIPNKYMELDISGTKAIIATIPLKTCLNIPGIDDGHLFRKNVRHHLGKNKVNKEIANTIKKNPQFFYFLHNGITALCSKMTLNGNKLVVNDFNVINGCQSLSTIYSCSQEVRCADDAYIMFKIYEINNATLSELISKSTNTQTTVKIRDLRSNDRCILNLKKSFEQYYPDGYLITKRGEKRPPSKNQDHVIDVVEIGKMIVAWFAQRPNRSYSETDIFNLYFDSMFKLKPYSPRQLYSLKQLLNAIDDYWRNNKNVNTDKDLNSGRSIFRFHHLYSISRLLTEFNKIPFGRVPDPEVTFDLLAKNNLLNPIVELSFNVIYHAMNTYRKQGLDNLDNGDTSITRSYNVVNWLKNKYSVECIDKALLDILTAAESFGNRDVINNYRIQLSMPNAFESRLLIGNDRFLADG